jgi:hypothetical protein
MKQYIVSEEELNKVVYFLEHLSGFETLIDNLKSKQPLEVLAEGSAMELSDNILLKGVESKIVKDLYSKLMHYPCIMGEDTIKILIVKE